MGTIFDNAVLGLQVALLPTNLLFCFLGVFLGTILGVIPGIGVLVAISLLFPITFHVDPVAALVLLAGIYYGTTYGRLSDGAKGQSGYGVVHDNGCQLFRWNGRYSGTHGVLTDDCGLGRPVWIC